jgi:hypothetical protein
MSKMTFIYESTSFDKSDISKVTLETNAVGIDEVLQQFECFLKGCGYHFGGHLEIVEDEDVYPQPSCQSE